MLRLWPARPDVTAPEGASFSVRVDGSPTKLKSGGELILQAGSRVTLEPGVWHEFFPASPECIIGEVSTANDDLHDNFFLNPDIGRFPGIEEDEPSQIRLVGE